MKILDGKEVKEKIYIKLKEKIKNEKLKLHLSVIQIGNNDESNIYLKQKEKMAKELNIEFEHIKLDKKSSEKDIIEKIDRLNKDTKVHGILIQLPLPSHINTEKIQNKIAPLKDIDGVTDINIGRLIHNTNCLISPTASGIIYLLEYNHIQIEGKNVTIIGRSNLVGKPLAILMNNHNATVSLCHSKTKNIKEYTKKADILIVAVGKKNFITKEYIKNGAIVIDIGINRFENKVLVGDVDFERVKKNTSFITPVPGGVGQTTIAALAVNIYKANKLRESKNIGEKSDI